MMVKQESSGQALSESPDPAVQTARSPEAQPWKVLVVFHSYTLYGMERAVIEMFDFLRPRVAPLFLMGHGTFRENLPVFVEVQRRGLPCCFFSDTTGWFCFRRPRSLRNVWGLIESAVKGNRDVLRQALRCDALYLPGIRYSFFSMLACVYCRLTGKPVIYQFHDWIARRSPALWFLRFAVRDFIHSTEIGFRFVSRTNPSILRRRNHVIPLVIHSSEQNGQSAEQNGTDDLPDKFSRGKRTILFAGQVSPHKGIDLLLQAIALLDGYPDAVLVIIGGCAPEFQLSFEALLADEKIAPRVVYLGYRQDVFRFMARAYVYVHPTPPSKVQESFGRGALEAMACAVPTICFPSGALGEIVVHRETGWICDREDAACLAGSLRLFLDDPQLRDRCGANAMLRYRTAYSPDRIVAAWERLLK